MGGGPASSDPSDRAHMRAALALARRGLGQVAPNPAVGCILVKEGRVIARGWTQPGGRPHAEAEALRHAGAAARGATAYVTLEPCAHQGRTPPCATALIEAGIARCVVALADPDPRVDGRGLARLRDAGIAVESGLLEDEARALNAGFLLRVTEQRPLVTLKLATTLDGRIATKSGESQWITGAPARERAHLLRATHDAIMVGGGTALLDDPRLDVRLPGLETRSPTRVVLDGRLRLPLTHDLVLRAGEQPTLLVTRDDAAAERLKAYRSAGLEVARVPPDESGRVDLKRALAVLAERGTTRLLVEGGGELAAALLRADLVDRLACFRAPKLIGGDGVSAAAGFGLEHLDEAPRFRLESGQSLGEDRLEHYMRVR